MASLTLPNAALASNLADRFAASMGVTLPRLRRPTKVAIRQLDERDNRTVGRRGLNPLDVLIACEQAQRKGIAASALDFS